jgi:hypothetical protein
VALLGIAVTTAGGAGSATTGGRAELKARQVDGRALLTNAKGFKPYWFAPDGPTKLNQCQGWLRVSRGRAKWVVTAQIIECPPARECV